MRRLGGSLLCILLGCLALPATVAGQQVQPSEALQRLAHMVGRWEGHGWQMRGPGQRDSATILEVAELRLGGSALVVEGLGRKDGRVVHSALGVITHDPAANVYRMRAFRADGHMVDTVIEPTADGVVWGFTDPRAGRIRYTATITADTWVERGEMSRDEGATWHPFMEMSLRRVN